jgi:hypothetical protein
VKYESSAVVLDGRVLVDVSRWPAAGDGLSVWVTVEEIGVGRSKRANAYYWGVVLRLIAEHTGHRADELHDVFCAEFLPNEQRELEFFSALTGERFRLSADARRSSRLSKDAFVDFVETVRQWAIDTLGVITPDPDPDYWRKR